MTDHSLTIGFEFENSNDANKSNKDDNISSCDTIGHFSLSEKDKEIMEAKQRDDYRTFGDPIADYPDWIKKYVSDHKEKQHYFVFPLHSKALIAISDRIVLTPDKKIVIDDVEFSVNDIQKMKDRIKSLEETVEALDKVVDSLYNKVEILSSRVLSR